MQNRPAPAYQEYAAAMLANAYFRMMSPIERGLLYTMRLECWVNHGLPDNPVVLSKILGLDLVQVEEALPAVMHFFLKKEGLVVCPELEDYRAHLDAIRAKQSEGGRRSASNKKSERKSTEGPVKEGNSDPQVACKSLATQAQVLSSVQSRPAKQSQKQSLVKKLTEVDASWANEYERASNGR